MKCGQITCVGNIRVEKNVANTFGLTVNFCEKINCKF